MNPPEESPLSWLIVGEAIAAMVGFLPLLAALWAASASPLSGPLR